MENIMKMRNLRLRIGNYQPRLFASAKCLAWGLGIGVKIKILKILLILGILVQTISCTHWITGSEVRIQVKNSTAETIRDLSLRSESGKLEVLVPEVLKSDSTSKVHDVEWAGKFDFVIFCGEEMHKLGTRRIKAGSSVVAQITKENGNFIMTIK
jgi:hypothetical protein